jgi:hypothetical protein
MVYDLCQEHWTPEERTACIAHINRTVDAGVGSETRVFRKGWRGYQQCGIGQGLGVKGALPAALVEAFVGLA